MSAGKRPAGPRGGLLLGSAPALKRDLIGFMSRAAADYGDLTCYRVGPLWVYQLNHPRLIKLVLQDYADKLRKPWDLRQLKPLLGEGLLTNDGPSWRAQRRLIQPAFHNDRIRRYGQTMSQYATEALDRWADGEPRDLSHEMMALTLRIVAKTLFGAEMGRQVAIVEATLELFMRQFERILTGTPIPMRWPTPGNLRALRAAAELHRQVRELMAQRRAEGAAGDDLLSWLLSGQAESGMSDRQVQDEVVTLLLAGHETTANALTWTLMLLARHPQAAVQLRGELDAVLAGRAPQVEDVPQLAYTRQVIQESMRLYPPAWAQSREVVEPIELDGYRLPAGVNVICPQYLLHRDSRFFEEPARFLPERWTPEFERALPKYAYFPFGGGPRFCIGSNFAMLEATLLLAAIAQRFRWELEPGHPIVLQPSVTLRPRHGLKARVFRRRAEDLLQVG